MQTPKISTTLFTKKSASKPKVGMLFVYLVLALSLCVFGASVWFSSYATKVHLRHKPLFKEKVSKIQHEIHKLELEENTLTDVERVRLLIKELGLVEPGRNSIELRDR